MFDTVFKTKIDAHFENKQTFLHYAAQNYSVDTFIYLFNISHDYLNKTNDKSETPLDILIDKTTKEDNNFFRKIFFKLPNIYEFKIKKESFKKICGTMNDRKDWDIFKIIIERTNFNDYDDLVPISRSFIYKFL